MSALPIPGRPPASVTRPTPAVDPAQGAATAGEPVPEPEPPTPAKATTEDLVSTGISGLDAQFGGGLPNGNLILVASEPTTATGIFAAQYAAAGLSAGETVVYLSMEKPATEVTTSVSQFLDDKTMLSRLHLLDGFPLQLKDLPGVIKKRLGVGGEEDPLEAFDELLVGSDLKPRVRFIVESYTELSDHYDEERVMRTVRTLRAVLRSLPATAIVMVVTPLHEPRTIARLQHVADGVIEFHVERKGFGIYPYIAVTKMRGVTGSARLLLFKETESGLWLESTKRVF